MNAWGRGVMNEGKGGNFPGAESPWGRELFRRAPKRPNNVTSTFFNAAHLLPKDLRFEHKGAKLQTCLLSRAPSNFVTSLAWGAK